MSGVFELSIKTYWSSLPSSILFEGVYMMRHELAWLGKCDERLFYLCEKYFLSNKGRYNLLPPITVGEIVECVRKYVDGVSHNLRSLSPYQTCPPTVILVLRIMVKQVKSSSQTSRYEQVNHNQSIWMNRFYPFEALNFIR